MPLVSWPFSISSNSKGWFSTCCCLTCSAILGSVDSCSARRLRLRQGVLVGWGWPFFKHLSKHPYWSIRKLSAEQLNCSSLLVCNVVLCLQQLQIKSANSAIWIVSCGVWATWICLLRTNKVSVTPPSERNRRTTSIGVIQSTYDSRLVFGTITVTLCYQVS